MNNTEEFKEGIWLELGSGSRILFWKDCWCNNSTLMTISPSLFSLARNKDAKVTDYWVNSEEGGDWNLEMRRHLND